MKKNLLHIVFALLLITTSCHKENSGVVTVANTKGVYIINQGNFGFGNADISFYNPDSVLGANNPVNGLFKGVNGYS